MGAEGAPPAAVVVVLGGPGAGDPGRALAAGLAGGGGGAAAPTSVVLAAKASRSLDRESLPAGLHCWGADPRTAGGVRTVYSRLLGAQPLAQVALVAPELPASGTLRSLQLYHALLEGLGQGVEVALFLGVGGQLPDRSHALQKVVYSAGGHCFEARGLWQKGADPQKMWQRNLRLCTAQAGLEPCSEANGDVLGGAADILALGTGRGGAVGGCLPFPPVVLSVKDQMQAAREVVERDLFLLGEGYSSWVPLKGSHLGRLVRSSSQRFKEGGYADLHYIRSNPCENGVYFELEVQNEDLDTERGSAGEHPAIEPAGFIALSVYAPGKGVPTPYAPPGRQLACAQIDRLVVLPKWRGHGCFRVLVERTCSAFCQHGYPVRIRTSNPHAREVLEGCGLFKYEGRILPGQQKCGVQKRRPRRIYVDLDPSGAPSPSSSGRLEEDESGVENQGSWGEELERRRFRASGSGSPSEAALRRLTSILNRITSDSAEKLLGILENLGRDAAAPEGCDTEGSANSMCGYLQLLADTVVGHAVRNHGPGTSILLARCAMALARGVSVEQGREGTARFTDSLVKALEVTRLAAHQVLRASESHVRAAPRFGGGDTVDGARDWAAGEAAGRLEAAAHLEAGLCEGGILSWEGGLERCRLALRSREGASPGAGCRVQVADINAACSFLSVAGSRAGPDCRRTVQGCVGEAERALSSSEAEPRARARERLAALVEAAAAGWPDASSGTAFSRGVGDVRREAARELGVELAPGRGEREGWAFWFSARDVRAPATGALWAFRGARAPGGPFAETNSDRGV